MHTMSDSIGDDDNFDKMSRMEIFQNSQKENGMDKKMKKERSHNEKIKDIYEKGENYYNNDF